MQNRVHESGPTLREQDPREALLKYADGTSYTERAYAKTQPKAVLAAQTAEQEAVDAAAEEQRFLEGRR